MSEPFLEDWWEGNEPLERPASTASHLLSRIRDEFWRTYGYEITYEEKTA